MFHTEGWLVTAATASLIQGLWSQETEVCFAPAWNMARLPRMVTTETKDRNAITGVGGGWPICREEGLPHPLLWGKGVTVFTEYLLCSGCSTHCATFKSSNTTASDVAATSSLYRNIPSEPHSEN